MENVYPEEIIFKYDRDSNLRCILIIDSTILGPKTCGGVRMLGYKTEKEAIGDGLKLAKAMTKKQALYNIRLGGAKAVILGDPKKDKTEAMLRAFGRFVDSLKGKYWTCIDMGFTMEDAKIIAQETEFIDSVEPSIKKGSFGPSGVGTGIGIVEGIKVAVKKVFGSSDFKNKKVAIQGLGSVGGTVAKLLVKQGATVIGADIDQKILKEAKKLGIQIVSPQEIYSVDCDVFCPCASGGTINRKTLSKLKCKIIAGGANNQLENYETGKKLAERGILYVPDFVINAGGAIQAEGEYEGITRKKARQNVKERIPEMVERILTTAEKTNKLPFEIAEEFVNKKLKKKR